MERFYNISDLHFENEFLVLNVDGIAYRIKISEVSDKLDKASDQIKNDFKISPSGYGIHWIQIDEDLSINGLIQRAKRNNAA
jgi:hypothetical protein